MKRITWSRRYHRPLGKWISSAEIQGYGSIHRLWTLGLRVKGLVNLGFKSFAPLRCVLDPLQAGLRGSIGPEYWRIMKRTVYRAVYSLIGFYVVVFTVIICLLSKSSPPVNAEPLLPLHGPETVSDPKSSEYRPSVVL